MLLSLACAPKGPPSAPTGCDPSITLPPGFCALVFADSVGPARHIAVRSNGDVYVGVLDLRRVAGAVLALRDTNKDGHADVQTRLGEGGVHGVVLESDSTLYASTADAILRIHLADTLGAKDRVDTIVTGLAQRQPPSHSLAIDYHGNLIVNVGAKSNGCATSDAPDARGADPCHELETSGGIWSFHPDREHQQLSDGTRIASGLHNAVALTINPADSTVAAVSHGRDGLHEGWPAFYSEADAAEAAGEEMIRVASVRADFGWPYCYYDYLKQERKLAPEYGGDGRSTARCDHQVQPLVAFPAHWAPMSLLFYTGAMFPAEYRGGAFIAFHGSAYRRPMPEDGYQVVFLHFKDGQATDYSVFASGFAGEIVSPTGAAHRPTGLAQGPDGALYLTDDKGGRVWKIVYRK
jgi:glucose/arabinose dehydrogenase